MTEKHGTLRARITPSPDIDEEVQRALLDAVSDRDCRQILKATADQALTAAELSDTINLPLSTVYRKLERLAETPLLEQEYRLAPDGKHARQYQCAIDRIHLMLSEVDESLLATPPHEESEDSSP